MINNFIKLTFLLLISPLIINFSSDTYINRSVSIEHCNLSNMKNYETHTSNLILPENMNVRVNNAKKWFENLLNIYYKIFDSESVKIPYQLKDYYDARIDIKYRNGIKCFFNGRVKIHGGGIDRSSGFQNTSLRVELFDGHINNINNFVLYRPQARRSENEIFITALLRLLGFLSPLTFGIKV